MCKKTSNKSIVSELLKTEINGKDIDISYNDKYLPRLKPNFQVFEICIELKKDIEKILKKKIKKELILKVNFPSIPFDLQDSAFYHKHYTPYIFEEEEMYNTAERQWKCQEIASNLGLSPSIVFKELYQGIIYTIMEKIDNNKIDMISGNKSFEFAKQKKQEIIKSLEKLHNNDIIHGDILTNSSFYTSQIHNIYYDKNKGVGFIDFGESRYKEEVLKNNDEEDFERWKKIEMDLVKEKLYLEIEERDYQEYLKINNILHNNEKSNYN